ncbi:MAG: response regulator transcription factor [Bacteroidia bacterium]
MIRIAIADDHPLLRQGIINYIQKDNIKVVLEAGDGSELLEKLNHVYENGEIIDVVILDISMKPMSGTECLPIISKSYPDIKTIIMSTSDEHQIIKEHWDLDIACYIIKTNGPSTLVDAINGVHQRGIFITDEMLPIIRGKSLGNEEVDIIQRRKEKLNITDREIEMMELMFYKEYSSKMLADHWEITHGAVDNAKNRLYNKFRDVGEYIHGELGLMRVAVQYGYVDIDRIGEDPKKE